MLDYGIYYKLQDALPMKIKRVDHHDYQRSQNRRTSYMYMYMLMLTYSANSWRQAHRFERLYWAHLNCAVACEHIHIPQVSQAESELALLAQAQALLLLRAPAFAVQRARRRQGTS